MEIGRPLCQILPPLTESLERLDRVEERVRPSFVEALFHAYKVTGEEWIKARMQEVVFGLLTWQEADGSFFTEEGDDLELFSAHSLRALFYAREVLEVQKEIFENTSEFFRKEGKDWPAVMGLSFSYLLTEKEEDLAIAQKITEGLEGENKVRGLCALYIVTQEKDLLEKAYSSLASLNKGDNEGAFKDLNVKLDIILWDVSGCDPKFYPAEIVSRNEIAKRMEGKEEVEWLRWGFGAVEGELLVSEGLDSYWSKLLEERKYLVKAPSKPRYTPLKDAVVLGKKFKVKKGVGCKGALFIGRVAEKGMKTSDVGEMEEIYGKSVVINAGFPYVVFICGHRGSGKSYTMGVLAEELARSNLGIGIIVIDPLGVFYSMKHCNVEKKEIEILEKWGMRPKGYPNTKVYVPIELASDFPPESWDARFSISASELSVDDWCHSFGIDRFGPQGLLIAQAIDKAKKGYIAEFEEGEQVAVEGKENFTIDDLTRCIERDVDISSKTVGFSRTTQRAAVARLNSAKKWGVFAEVGTPLTELSVPNQVTVIDVSHPRLGEGLRALFVGILARKILRERTKAARYEETEEMLVEVGKEVQEMRREEIPFTWLAIDEAHLLVPSRKETAASIPIVEYAKQGRKPGCALLVCTQQPSATDPRVLSQADLMIVHTLTYEDDVKAYIKRAPSPIPDELKSADFVRRLPVGVAIVSDKESDRAIVVAIRARSSMHAGREARPKMEEKPEPSPIEEVLELVSEVLEEEGMVDIDVEAPTPPSEVKVMVEDETDVMRGISIISPSDVPKSLLKDFLKRKLLYPHFTDAVAKSKDGRILPYEVSSIKLGLTGSNSASIVISRIRDVEWKIVKIQEDEKFPTVIFDRGGMKLGIIFALLEDGLEIVFTISPPNLSVVSELKRLIEGRT